MAAQTSTAMYCSVVPKPLAIAGLSAIISALLGQLALQPASGPPPGTTGEKRKYGKNETTNIHATAARSAFSSVPPRRPSGKLKTSQYPSRNVGTSKSTPTLCSSGLLAPCRDTPTAAAA